MTRGPAARWRRDPEPRRSEGAGLSPGNAAPWLLPGPTSRGTETFAPFPCSRGFVRKLRGPVMRVRRLFLLLLLGARPVWAHSVSNELALGLSEDSPESPHGTHIANQLTLRFDLDDDWTLKVGGAYTYDTEAPPPTGATFGTSSAQILNAVAGVEWDATPRVNLYLDVSGSPRASQRFSSVVSVSVPTVPIPIPVTEVQLFNASSNIGALLGATFTLGGTEFLGTVIGGTALDVSVGWTLLSTQQRVDAIIDGQGRPVSRETLLAICRAVPDNRGCKLLEPYLKGGQDTLNQVSLSLSVLQ